MRALVAIALLATTQAVAAPVSATLHGDLKSFYVTSFPSQWLTLSDDAAPLIDAMGLTEDEALQALGLSSDPMAMGSASARLKLDARWRALRLEAHGALTSGTAVPDSGLPGMSTGAGLSAPEALPLSWRPDTGGGMTALGRMDRLTLSAALHRVDLSVGRQPISFGTGMFFTPMDLVNPFHPATIDTEYKPGVDSLRVDAYAGVSSKITVAVAYAGDAPLVGPERSEGGAPLDDLVLAATAQGTVGVTDVIGFAGAVHGEPVLGLGTMSSVGPVGLHGELTLTLPTDEDPFVRAVAGADWRPTGTTTLMAEGYVQTLGGAGPSHYLDNAHSERLARGELWQLGRSYAALSVAQEITPLVAANAALVANVEDPSGLGVAGLSWSVADNATVGAGAYLGLGQRPEEVPLSLALDPSTGAPSLIPPSDEALATSVRSEFGLYPSALYLQLRTYF
ncbi:MAG: hypothetical protein JXX28_03340 [Deltaproteobacteria bacterium]|nr:hypothetical protein [Deltaproteobacteria bacterium]